MSDNEKTSGESLPDQDLEWIENNLPRLTFLQLVHIAIEVWWILLLTRVRRIWLRLVFPWLSGPLIAEILGLADR